ncbi:MAG TPA: AAA family ATPase [Ktedonobacteraceae bacterium]
MDIRLFGSLEIEDGQRCVGPDDLGGRKPQQLLPQALPSLRTIQTQHIDIPFLGRQPELTFLEYARRTTEQGVLLVTVQGEAGIGKSRLVAEFLQQSELCCGRAKCTELERDLPFSGLATALTNLLTPLNAHDAARALMAGPTVVELISELAGKASLTSRRSTYSLSRGSIWDRLTT